MSGTVFISHAQKDNEAAKYLVKKLSNRGVEAWLDEYITLDTSWHQQIKDALIKSGTVVLLLGEGDPSPNVLVEAGMALGQGKKIVPVVVAENANLSLFPNLQRLRAVNEKEINSAADQSAAFVSN